MNPIAFHYRLACINRQLKLIERERDCTGWLPFRYERARQELHSRRVALIFAYRA